MRVLLTIGLIGLGAATLALIVGFGWLFFDSRGLPDAQAVAMFAPSTEIDVSDPCIKTPSVAIPYNSIGANLRAALNAVEAREDDPSVLTETYRSFTDKKRLHRATLSFQISRTMFCGPSKPLTRLLDEFRTAVQLERRLSHRQMFTILANRLAFEEELVGVKAASQHYFHKEPSQLLVGEAALLAGLVRAPSYFSPIKHPDRALQRRNEVVDAMAATGAISESEATTAKSTPLPITID